MGDQLSTINIWGYLSNTNNLEGCVTCDIIQRKKNMKSLVSLLFMNKDGWMPNFYCIALHYTIYEQIYYNDFFLYLVSINFNIIGWWYIIWYIICK